MVWMSNSRISFAPGSLQPLFSLRPFGWEALFALQLNELQPLANLGFRRQVLFLCGNLSHEDCAPAVGDKDRRLRICLSGLLQVAAGDSAIAVREQRERQRQFLRQLAQTITFIRRNREHFSFYLLILAVMRRDLLQQPSALSTLSGAEEDERQIPMLLVVARTALPLAIDRRQAEEGEVARRLVSLSGFQLPSVSLLLLYWYISR